jgi:hypothetical protein
MPRDVYKGRKSMTEYARYEEQNWPQRSLAGRSTGASTATSIAWLLVGIGVGAGVALLLTPTNGREVRNSIARTYRRTVAGISRGTQELRQRGSNLISFNRRRSGQQKSQQA